MQSDRIGGLISILIGLIAIWQSAKLFPARITTFVGDHVLPGAAGTILVLLGLALVAAKGREIKVEFPDRKTITDMVTAIILLVIYWLAIEYVGYVISTALVLVGLFKVVGHYNVGKSVLLAVITSAALYLIFIYWLAMPFPRGLFDL